MLTLNLQGPNDANIFIFNLKINVMLQKNYIYESLLLHIDTEKNLQVETDLRIQQTNFSPKFHPNLHHIQINSTSV